MRIKDILNKYINSRSCGLCLSDQKNHKTWEFQREYNLDKCIFFLQILYGPRRTKNLGLTDGEGIERLWSYLGKFSSITKEMSPENRTDLLTDGLIYYGQKIKDKLGNF